MVQSGGEYRGLYKSNQYGTSESNDMEHSLYFMQLSVLFVIYLVVDISR